MKKGLSMFRIFALLPLMLWVGTGPGVAQKAVPNAAVAMTKAPAITARDVEVAPVPFGPGERAWYEVRLAGVNVGRGSMEVLGVQPVHGHPTYHTRFTLNGGVPLVRVDDNFESWIDVAGVFSRRFRQDQKEAHFKRKRAFDFFPESRTFRRTDETRQTGTLPTDRPLDDVSFLYYARTLPLKVGETYRLNQYFKDDGNPVVLKVLRKETVTVPAGTFRTVVVQPVIKTKGLFSEGGEAEVYFTDDDRRLLVQLKSKVSRLGNLTLQLQDYRPGKQYTPGS